jgi:hypothetical protein
MALDGEDNPIMRSVQAHSTLSRQGIGAAAAPEDPVAFLRGLYQAAVDRALPALTISTHLPPPPTHGRTLVLGAGKAGGAMAAAVNALWPATATRHPPTAPHQVASPSWKLAILCLTRRAWLQRSASRN